MAQLVELNKNAEKFSELGVEVVVVFREEDKGVDGLKLIQEKTKVPFQLALDKNKEKTSRYSPDKMTFNNYVVDSSGNVVAIIEGDLRKRAKSKALLEILVNLAAKKGPNRI